MDGEPKTITRMVESLFTLSMADSGQLRLMRQPLYLNDTEVARLSPEVRKPTAYDGLVGFLSGCHERAGSVAKLREDCQPPEASSPVLSAFLRLISLLMGILLCAVIRRLRSVRVAGGRSHRRRGRSLRRSCRP